MNMIRTHEDAEKVIREACAGAPVTFEKIVGGAGENTEKMRRYLIGDNNVQERTVALYALPFDPTPVLKSIRKTLSVLYDRD